MKTVWILVWVVAGLVAELAIAREHTFIFRINSSSSKLYACNAGIKHIKPTNEVCYVSGTTNPCTRGTHDCECFGPNTGGYLTDYIQYKQQNILPNDNTTPLVAGTVKVDGQGQDVWKTIPQGMSSQSHNPNPFFTLLKELTFNFGSERYGTEMFLDVCYRGPQIEFFEDNMNTSYALKATVLATDLNPNNEPGFVGYQTLSGLNVSAEAVCDVQGLGNYQLARDDNNFVGGRYDSFNHEIQIDTPNNNDWKSIFPFTSTVTGNVLTVFDELVTNDSPESPRFCMIRYLFKETASNNLRKWQRHDAQVKVLTVLED